MYFGLNRQPSDGLRILSDHEQLVQKTKTQLILSLIIIGVISTASFLTLNFFTQTQKADASTINIAGRQRMLSQRTALGVSMLKNQLLEKKTVSESLREQIINSAKLMHSSHVMLSSTDDPELQQLYFIGDPSLDTELNEYVKAALNIAKSQSVNDLKPKDTLYFEAENVSYLLFRLNVLVNTYEEKAESKLHNSIVLMAILWLVLLISLYLTFRLLFKPILTLIKQSFIEQKIKERRIQLAADSAQLGIWQFDLITQELTWDKQMWRIFYESEPQSDIVSLEQFQYCLHPEDAARVMHNFSEAVTDLKELDTTFRIISPNDTIKYIKVYSIAEKNEYGKAIKVVGTNKDITDQVLREDALLIAKEKAEAATRIKGDFLASMSHEIRTPLNGVMGMLNLLKNTPLNNLQNKRLDIALSSAKSLLALINDILDFSKIEADKLQIEVIDFDLNNLLEEIIESLGQLAEEKHLELILDTIGLNTSRVMGDPNRIRQVITNLIANAIKFTHEGHVILNVSLSENSNDTWQMNFSVEDTGIGIPEDKQAQLFDAFSQVDTSTTRQYGGTGLGLAIVKRLCIAMGGAINVRSKLNRGSRFYGSILLSKSTKTSIIAPTFDVTKLYVLVVDDNTVNSTIVHDQLAHWGIHVTVANSAEQAILICEEHIENHKSVFDIALIDMQMPHMNGIQLGKLLKQDPRYANMHLVLMTSMMMELDNQEIADSGFTAFFTKPVTNSDLFLALNVLGENGEALNKASPLLTHDFIRDLKHSDDHKPKSIRDNIKQLENKDILVVEDNAINQMVIEDLLSDLGFHVKCVDDGLFALTELNLRRSQPYCLILMDCQMPRMDGFETTREIRKGKAGQLNSDIPIVAITANNMQGDQQKCLDSGMNDFISKPIEQEQLERVIRSWLLAKF